MNRKITQPLDVNYLTEQYEKWRKRAKIYNYVDDINLTGIDNLRELEGQQFMHFSNHLSHFDYMLLGWLFLENLPVDEFPKFLAGKNLDSRILAGFGLDFRKMGAFFIDREGLTGKQAKRRQLARDIRVQLTTSIREGNSFIDFLEGTRSRNGLLTDVKTGFLSSLIRAHQSPRKQEYIKKRVDPFILVSAINYDSVIEESYFPVIDFAKKRKLTRPLYYATDLFAFLMQRFNHHKGDAYISFSQPRRLSKILEGSKKPRNTLLDYITSEIKTQYRNLR
ncbi:MAG: 1-acyl-sn-glycerol-3-phosphate acyltransferase [Candidatus Nanoarchaeia archaeon]